jgi:peptidoglycan/LPS O-acetylase OafA/YrhL
MGVDIFFVLSGYLITALLLAERRETGTISLRRFYARRALRLYPALLLVLLLGVPFARELGGLGYLDYFRMALRAALYLQDLVTGLTGFSQSGFDHTWSLAVEEQFYILWPSVLVYLVVRGRDPLRWAAGGTIGSWVWLAATSWAAGPNGRPNSYFLPWTRCGALLLGCCVAILLTRREAPAWIRRRSAGWLLAVVGGALMYDAASRSKVPHLGWEIPAIDMVAAGLILHLSSAVGGARRVLSAPPLAFIGRRSYGVYLFMEPVIVVTRSRFSTLDRYLLVLVQVAVIFALAFASYQLVELPFLRLKRRMAPHGDGAHATIDSCPPSPPAAPPRSSRSHPQPAPTGTS